MGMTSNEKKKSSTQKPVKSSSILNKKTEGESKLILKENKKIWSFDILVEAMKPSDKELEYRKKKSKESDDLQKYSKLFQCTKCQKSFETILKKHEKVPTHPCLGVLMCQKCCDYYEDGEFSLDSEGEDKYCRWCGEGGTIFGCFKCISGFCANCIKRHFKPEYFKKVQKDDNWLCFFCDPKPLWDLRYICSLAEDISKNQKTLNFSLDTKKNEKNIANSSFKDSKESLSNQNSDSKLQAVTLKKTSRKRIYSSSSDESENEAEETHKKKLKPGENILEDSFKKKENSFENVKSKALKELEKILKLSKYHMNFGVSWSTQMLEKLLEPDQISCSEELVSKCQKIKWLLSVLSTNLVQFCNSIDLLEKHLLDDDELKTPLDFPDEEKPSYITILQFLGFINNQIKTFMEKGISLSDVLEAEIYNDDHIIGIKKKLNAVKCTVNENKNNKAAENKLFKGDESEGLKSKDSSVEQKGENGDRSKDGNSLEIVLDQSSDMVCRPSSEVDDEYKSLNYSNITSEEGNHLKKSESRDDIQKILAILENA